MNTGTSFTLSIGLFNPQVFKLVFSSVIPKEIKIADCIVYFSMGELLADFDIKKHKDIWWDMKNDTEEELIIKTICENILIYIVPFLNAIKTLQQLEEFIINNDYIMKKMPTNLVQQIALKTILGKDEGVVELYDKVIKVHDQEFTKKVNSILLQAGFRIPYSE